MVAVAGPGANILMAFTLAVVFHVLRMEALPLLGGFVLLAILYNIILAVFNLIPIPPLDGSRIVYASLKSPEAISTYRYFSQFGIFVLIGFLLLGGFDRVIWPLVTRLYDLLGLPSPL
jgi:Zn-dependent protease